jgi:hypothetical protein
MVRRSGRMQELKNAGGHLTRRGVALLRSAAAAEILEMDFNGQYNGFGGIQVHTPNK